MASRSLKVTPNVTRTHGRNRGSYSRPRCPRCGNQGHCKKLNELKGWCGNCQQGFSL